MALFNPETLVLIQKRHPYRGNLNSETPGDSKTRFLHWGDVLAIPQEHTAGPCFAAMSPSSLPLSLSHQSDTYPTSQSNLS